MSDKNRRLIIPPTHESKRIDVVDRIASVDIMINDAYNILKEQIERLRIKSTHGAMFTEKEAKALQILLKSMTEVSAEERARLKSDEYGDMLAGMSDEQLLELLKSRKKA